MKRSLHKSKTPSQKDNGYLVTFEWKNEQGVFTHVAYLTEETPARAVGRATAWCHPPENAEVSVEEFHNNKFRIVFYYKPKED